VQKTDLHNRVDNCEDCPDFPPGKCPGCFITRLVMGKRDCAVCGGTRVDGAMVKRIKGKSVPVCGGCKLKPGGEILFLQKTWRGGENRNGSKENIGAAHGQSAGVSQTRSPAL
jgi:hypothetical protein